LLILSRSKSCVCKMLDEGSEISASDKLIRKLRKKLRQIERLEILGRPLNEEEIAKVKQKKSIRSELYKELEATREANVDVPPIVTDLESGMELMEMSENSPAKDSDCNDPLEEDHSDDTHNQNHSVTVSSAEPGTPELARDGKEPVETIENEISNQPENDAQPNPEPESLTVRMPSKRASPNCESPALNKTTTSKRKKCEPPAEKLWIDNIQMEIMNLKLHNDLVCCVDMDSDYIISGSRDTLVQVWDAKDGAPIQSLRGHSNTVTCVSLLSMTESSNLTSLLSGTESSSRLGLSASLDCCLKLWNITDGTMLSSIYTFSGITAMCYYPLNHSCLIGSEGGKLEAYSLSDEQPNPLISHRAFDGPVSSIKLVNEQIICCSLDGLISVYTLKNENGLEFCRLFHSECLVSKVGQSILTRPVLSLALTGSSICYGDEGVNLKLLNWKQGEVKKLRNHVHEFGLTNAICSTESFLLSSSLDVDSGCSSINVRSMPDLKYEGTLAVDAVERIVCIAATQTDNGSLKIVAGGSKLTLIETKANELKNSEHVKPFWNKELVLAAEDSADESDCSSSDDESDQEEFVEESPSKNSTSWCNLL